MVSALMRYLIFLPLLLTGSDYHFTGKSAHPYYVSVTEIDYKEPDNEIQIAIKIFTDDFEQALKNMYQVKVDIINPVDKPGLNKKISGYILQHFSVRTDNRPLTLQFLGFEIEGEAAWCYFSAEQTGTVNNIKIFNNLLYEYKKEQINIMHSRVQGERKSARLTYPDTSVQFSF